MAHILAPKPANITLPVFFNVDGVVGASPAQNGQEDVLLVQFAFRVLATAPRPTTPPALIEAAKGVSMTGSIDQATISAIRVFQREAKSYLHNKQVVDGRVSPARGDYAYGRAEFWTIVNLNDVFQDRYTDLWPRLDKIPGCPELLKQMVIRQVVGKGMKSS